MRITFPVSLVVILTSFFTVLIVNTILVGLPGCTPNQVTSAQGTLTKVESATTQATQIASTVSATPSPISGDATTVANVGVFLLLLEKLFGTYLLPYFKKVANGTSQLSSQSAITTTKPPV